MTTKTQSKSALTGTALTALVALTACGSGPQAYRSFNDPAVQALFAKPVAEYYADVRLSKQIASFCSRYSFDTVLDLEISERRNAQGRGAVAALTQRGAIETMTDIRTREFRARNGVAPGEGDVCPAADAETARASSISALLIPEGAV